MLNGFFGIEFECFIDCLFICNGGGVVDFVLQGVLMNGVGVSDGLLVFGGVDDQGDFVVFDYVYYVWVIFGYFVYVMYWQVCGFDDMCGIGGGYYFEVQCDQVVSYLGGEWFVVFVDVDEGVIGGWEDFVGF